MIDWHSHILPALDDGSRDVTESVELVNMLSAQGIDTVIATPHFLADHESAEKFLKRRKEAFETLKAALDDKAPQIICGAEVKYYPGISKMEKLQSLCIEGTNLILIEMSLGKWTEITIRELEELSSSGKLTVVLAHVERYFNLQSKNNLNRLYEAGIIMQANASFFNRATSRRKAISQLSNGELHLIGSDCHNTSSRAPQIGNAYKYIEKKLGAYFINRLNEYAYSLLENK